MDHVIGKDKAHHDHLEIFNDTFRVKNRCCYSNVCTHATYSKETRLIDTKIHIIEKSLIILMSSSTQIARQKEAHLDPLDCHSIAHIIKKRKLIMFIWMSSG